MYQFQNRSIAKLRLFPPACCPVAITLNSCPSLTKDAKSVIPKVVCVGLAAEAKSLACSAHRALGRPISSTLRCGKDSSQKSILAERERGWRWADQLEQPESSYAVMEVVEASPVAS